MRLKAGIQLQEREEEIVFFIYYVLEKALTWLKEG